jgi:peptide chain release factor 1
MDSRLSEIKDRCRVIELEMSRPEVISNQNKFRALGREHSQIAPIVQKFEEKMRISRELEDNRELLKMEKDPGMKDLLNNDIMDLEGKLGVLEEQLMILLLPKDQNSGKDIIMEIRAGTGGEEAALFSANLFRMYSRYADTKKWKIELLEMNQTEIGGYKEIIFSVKGADAYDDLKFESGVHRVQRIPTTESQGRIHTSAVTVAVLPEVEESDVEISPEDIRIDVYRASGHGGQSVNTTDSAVRLTHIPTGMIVTCQDEKSQLKNKAKAMRVLRARLFEKIDAERMEKESLMRKSQVGSGDRSERIRTYNFPQSRVTDHRIGLTLYALDKVLDGELDSLVEPLRKNEIEQILKSGSQ